MCSDCDADGWAQKITMILDEAKLSDSTITFLESVHDQAEDGHLTEAQIAAVKKIADEKDIDL